MDPQQELFSYLLVTLKKEYRDMVFDGFMPPEKTTYQTGNSNKNRRIYGRRNCCYRTKGNEQNRIKYIMKIPEDVQKIKRKNMKRKRQ